MVSTIFVIQKEVRQPIMTADEHIANVLMFTEVMHAYTNEREAEDLTDKLNENADKGISYSYEETTLYTSDPESTASYTP